MALSEDFAKSSKVADESAEYKTKAKEKK